MDKMIKINNNEVSIKEYKGQRVVTFKDIDMVHNRPNGTAHRNFKNNRMRFIEGVDFYNLQGDEIRLLGIKSNYGGYVITETGYLMLVKSFTDDLAWTVQRELVNNYFNTRKAKIETQEQPYEFVMKYYNNEPVVTVKDIEHKTGISSMVLRWYVKKLTLNKEYFLLEGNKLNEFKSQNPKVSTKFVSSLIIINEAGFIKLAKLIKQPKNCIEFKRIEPIPKKVRVPYYQCIDAPDNPKVQNAIELITQDISTLKNLLTLYNRYISLDDKDKYIRVITDVGCQIFSRVNDFARIPVKVIEKIF